MATTPWLLLCRVVRVTPGAHADTEEHAADVEAKEGAQAEQEKLAAPLREGEQQAAAADSATEAQEGEGRAAVGEDKENAQAQQEKHAAPVREAEKQAAVVDSATEAQEGEGRAAIGEAEEDDPQADLQALLEKGVVNVNTDAAAAEAAHAAHGAAEPDFIISVAPPLQVSSLIAGRSCHPNPERPDKYPYIIASGSFCLLGHFAMEPSYGTNFSEYPNQQSHLVVGRHFRRAADGQITACAVRVPDRPKNMLKLSSVNSVGLVCNHQTGDYKIAELAIPSGCTPFFMRFSSDIGVWEMYRLRSPLDADDDRREWVPHGTIVIDSTVIWFDLSWGIISCDLALQPSSLPILDFHHLPHGRLLDRATADMHNTRCIVVSENLVRYVEIILTPHQGDKVSMWHRDVEHNPCRWITDYEETFEHIWSDDSYRQTGLPPDLPMLVGVCPVNFNVVYFSLNQRLFGVNVPDHRVVNCEPFEPLQRLGLPDEPFTSRYLLAWNLHADGGTEEPLPSSSPLCSHAKVPLPLVPAPTSSIKGTPCFDICLDDFANSLSKALESIRGFFNSISNNDLAQGKLVTKIWGCFLIRIVSSINSIENPIYALYRTNDLYLDSVFSNKIWYRLKDHQAILPPEVEYEGSVTLGFKSNYKSLNCDPDKKNRIMVGLAQVMKHIETLQQLALNCNSYIEEVQKAFVLLILFMEALRFPQFEKWLLIWISRKECKYIPLEYTELFRMWGKLSAALHGGKHEFYKAPEIVKKYCRTYNDVCELLGIVNRVNLRKVTKATKTKKKNTRWDDEEADSSSHSERGKKKRR